MPLAPCGWCAAVPRNGTSTPRASASPVFQPEAKWEANHIPAEMHIYAYGGHGFALRPTRKPAPVTAWPDRLKEWLADPT